MNDMIATEEKQTSPEEAQHLLTQKNEADIEACVAEINSAVAQHLNPILKKYGCVQTFRVLGEGNQMQVQQIILKQP